MPTWSVSLLCWYNFKSFGYVAFGFLPFNATWISFVVLGVLVGILLACLLMLLFCFLCFFLVDAYGLIAMEMFVSNMETSLVNVYFSVLSSGCTSLLVFAFVPRFSHFLLLELGGWSLFVPVSSFPGKDHSYF